MNVEILVRDYEPSDEAFIISTWLKGLRYGNDWFKQIDHIAYFKNYHAVIERILASKASVKVACLADAPDVVLGYAVYLDDRLDWVFVKRVWRNIGVSKRLVPDNIKYVTHLTRSGKNIADKRGYVFNPFLVG